MLQFDIDQFSDSPGHADLESLLSDAWVLFTQNLQKLETADEESKHQQPDLKRHQVLVKVTVVDSPSLDWTLDTGRERYSLRIMTRTTLDQPRDDIQIFVKSHTYYGAIYAFETLSQLVTFHQGDHFLPDNVKVIDRPVYAYRGVLLDTSRNFYSVDSIKKVVDGMAYNKLNVLHWHITDANSFPFVSQRVPNMAAYGAYSQRQVFVLKIKPDFYIRLFNIT